MHLKQASYVGDPNIGLYVVATNKFVIAPDNNIDGLNILSENIVYTKISETDFIGIFVVANSKGVLLPSIMGDMRFNKLKEDIYKIDKNINVEILDDIDVTALGNLIVCNDDYALISPLLENYKEKIENVLKVEVFVSKLIDMDIVGSVCVATNKGFLLSSNAEKEDYEFVENVFKIEGDIGSVNFGSPFVKSGIIVNDKSVLIGTQTSGPEITRIDEAFGFLKK
jgi:translation initiation factor 6